ncbi:MAG: DUF1599 domain-containing protein [Porphyromonas sp.]|nr:DUF1599 domain-containing protein [Porphyromonas sp.]
MTTANTSDQYDEIVSRCRRIFELKLSDYGASWSVMRPTAITDQMFIKLSRIRTIEETGTNLVNESITGELMALVNYGAIGLALLEHGSASLPDEVSTEKALEWYDNYLREAKSLMQKKNHDYGEAWRSMRLSSLTDLMLTKIFRTKQLEDHPGTSKISEGIDANYYDIINYSIFALIRIVLEEEENK